MRFWLKIGVLAGLMYVGCYGSMLLQDRREHRAVIREVETVTRDVAQQDIGLENQQRAEVRLNAAKAHLIASEARWKGDAHMLLLSSATGN